MTYSIVACDLKSTYAPEWGVAVASKFLAVGGVVPWAGAGVGGVATQALANLTYIPEGRKLLSRGADAAAVVRSLTEGDAGRDHRQLGVVDASGNAATFTGAECMAWAGGRTGDGYCCQGNILVGPEVVNRAAEAFEAANGELAVRLLIALEAGDAAGGDSRGRQSAALIVAREGGGYLSTSDRAVDLRVDDHADPVGELRRLLQLHQLYFPRPESLEFIDIDPFLAEELGALLRAVGQDPGPLETAYDKHLKDALFNFVGIENLEERWSDEAKVELAVLEHLRLVASL
jgi:uncharacterized Ntn-hydrolase superfamily protein